MSKAKGSVIQQKGKIQTGSSSRIELELPYPAVVRVGSNADLNFSPDAKKMSLKSGTLMLSLPKETAGVEIESGSVVTALTKGDLEMSNVGGQVKVITLNGKVSVSLAANPSDRRRLKSGEMVDVPAGATQMPPVSAIKLSLLIKTSTLINMGPFPGLRAIKQNATKQTGPMKPFVAGGFDSDFNTGSLSSIGPAGAAAMISRMEQGQPLPPPPVIASGAIPTQAQVVALEAAGLPVPNVSNADAQRILRGQPVRSPPVAAQPTPPVIAQPTPRPRPPVVRPPSVLPRPTPRPPIAVP